jgi:SAM-dependent methyltransferase
MAAIDDQIVGAAISARVAEFYERHPYPLPVDNLAGYGRSWDNRRRKAEAHLIWPAEPYRDDRSILVAGCGTSQAAKYALRWPNAQVVGIDFSKSSIDHTERLKRKHSIRNLELLELPIERTCELGRRFDLIVCTGVLHHLADPDAGLRALREIMEPNGAMYLMVYAPYGRTGIYMLQDYCRRLAIGTSASDIRELAESLRSLPEDHPLMPLLHKAPDFRSEAGLADALLHPRDRAYSVPELFGLLASADLEFGRWIRQAPYLADCGAIARSPHHQKMARLPADEQFAAVELFRGSMIRHSLIAYRSDRVSRHTVRFDGDDWLSSVPIRIADTIAVEESLPPGAAVVLINRSHVYTDIYLPLDASEKAIFNRIDGAKSIREILADGKWPSNARSLFERLWKYDQIVFDITRSSEPPQAQRRGRVKT